MPEIEITPLNLPDVPAGAVVDPTPKSLIKPLTPAQLTERDTESSRSVIESFMKPVKTAYAPTAMKIDSERYGGLFTTPVLANNPALMEQAAARTQSWGDRLWNDAKVTGVNFGGMFASIFSGTFDMLKDMDLNPSKDSITAKVAEEMAAFSNRNANFSSTYDFENPIKSSLLPAFLTGSSKGWGELVKSVAFGMGAMAGLAAEEIAITYATGGMGTIPGLAAGIRNILRTSKTINQIAEASVGTASLVNKSKQISGAMRAADYGLRGLNLSKDLARHYISAFGEAEFEAQESRESVRIKLMQDFYAKNGYTPTGADLAEINRISEQAHDTRFALNAGMLMLTNHAMLKTIFKPFHKVTGLADKATELGYKPFLNDLKSVELRNTTKLDSKFWLNNKVGKLLKEPIEKAYPVLSNFVKKGGITWSEGFEEGYQYLVGKSTDNYYTNFGNSNYNKQIQDSVFEDVQSVLGQMYKDKGLLTSDEGITSILTGILAGSGQQVISNLVGNYSYSKEKGFTNLAKQAREAFEADLPKTNTDLTNFLKEAVEKRSLKETPTEAFEALKASYTIDQHQDSVKDPLTLELLRSQARFTNYINGIKLGQDKIITDLLEDQVSGLTVEQFNNLTGAKVENEQQKGKLITDIKNDIKTAKSSFEKVQATFRNPYANTSSYFDAFEDLKNGLTYHDYMINQIGSLISTKESQANTYSKDGLVQGLVTSNKLKVADELKAQLLVLQEQLTSFQNLGEGQTLSPESKKQKQLLEKKIQAVNEIAEFTEDDEKSIKKAIKLVPILKGFSDELNESELNNTISQAYTLAKAKNHLETHIKTFDRLSKVNKSNFVDIYSTIKGEAHLTNSALDDLVKNSKAESTSAKAEESAKGDQKAEDIIKQEATETSKPVEEVAKKVTPKEPKKKIKNLKDVDFDSLTEGQVVLLEKEPFTVLSKDYEFDAIVVENPKLQEKLRFLYYENQWQQTELKEPTTVEEPPVVEEPPIPEEPEAPNELQASIESKLIRPFTIVVKNSDGTYRYVKQKDLTEDNKAHIKNVHAYIVRAIAGGYYNTLKLEEVEIDNSADGLFSNFPAEKSLIIDNSVKSKGLVYQDVVFFEKKPKEMFKVSADLIKGLSLNTKFELKESYLLYDVVQAIKDRPSDIKTFLKEFYNPGYEHLGFERFKDFVLSYFETDNFKPNYVAMNLKQLQATQPVAEFNQPYVQLSNKNLEYVVYFHNQWYFRESITMEPIIDESTLEELEKLRSEYNWKSNSFLLAQGKDYQKHLYFDVFLQRADDVTPSFIADLKQGLEATKDLSSLANELQNKYWIGSSIYDAVKATGKSLSFFIDAKKDKIVINLKVDAIKVGKMEVVDDKVVIYNVKDEPLAPPTIIERVAMTDVTLDKFKTDKYFDQLFPVLEPIAFNSDNLNVPLPVDTELQTEPEVESEVPLTPFDLLKTDGIKRTIIENNTSKEIIYYVKDDATPQELAYLEKTFNKEISPAKLGQLLTRASTKGLKIVNVVSFNTERYITEDLEKEIERLKEICK